MDEQRQDEQPQDEAKPDEKLEDLEPGDEASDAKGGGAVDQRTTIKTQYGN